MKIKTGKKDKIEIRLFNPTSYHEHLSKLFDMVTIKILRIWKLEDDAFNEFNIKIRIIGKG